MATYVRPLAGLTQTEGYAVGADAAPVGAAPPGAYAERVAERQALVHRLRSSQIFAADEPWAADSRAGGGGEAYLRPLSQRDRAALLAETAVAASPEEAIAAQEEQQRE